MGLQGFSLMQKLQELKLNNIHHSKYPLWKRDQVNTLLRNMSFDEYNIQFVSHVSHQIQLIKVTFSVS